MCILWTGSAFAAIPYAERQALIALYNSTHGEKWGKNTGWKTPPLHSDGFSMPGTEGGWYGVTVASDHVISIKQSFNNLTGVIPRQLENFTHLRVLNLSHNRLSGAIPPQLGNLRDLQYLYLYYNSLRGPLPPELGKLVNLYALGLSGNSLCCVIPPELGNLRNLTTLEMQGCALSGAIPPELGRLSQLRKLNLQVNFLMGAIPPTLGKLRNLITLYLRFNNLSSAIPSALGNLSNLQDFWLCRNQLSGSIPPELGHLSHLVSLYLDVNQLSGAIPPELGDLSNLIWLDISHNRLSGAIPPQLGNLGNLHLLNLHFNQLTDVIPSQLGNSLQLKCINLSFNQLTGSIPPELGNLRNLDELILKYNRFSGSIPSELGNISILRRLLLSHNFLSGDIPSQLCDLKMLITLDIGYNCLSATNEALIRWIRLHQPDWESHQNNCGAVLPDKTPPFGSLDTPLNGAVVSGSIPVSGWALDNNGVVSVKIYRNKGKMPVYIGDAVFVRGARPDVEKAYPEYPFRTSAGWGYMMLTNILPERGNGTFIITAVAVDLAGNATTLGTRAIHVDNAHGVKPFGAIDTPTPGGTASGDQFINWGWVLTPPPNFIPVNGSTLNVWVDGVNKGHPVYNCFRSDIVALFPGYANIQGSGGFFYLDTTKYADGLHSIQWTATDNVGNSEGIGSRYFTIQNPSNLKNNAVDAPVHDAFMIESMPCWYPEPVKYRTGFQTQGDWRESKADEQGNEQIVIKELERIEIPLSAGQASIHGYLTVSGRLTPLPAGSTLDGENGTFYWQPGPGFLGGYTLVFVFTESDGQDYKKLIDIIIQPKFQP